MDSSITDMTLVAVGSGIIGFIIGALIMRGLRPKNQRQLESQLEDIEQKLRQKNAQIAEHFTHTASLVSNLTRNYRDLHDYLASSAQQLGNIDIQPVLLSDDKAAPILGTGAVINPPLDYAPQKNNTLSEAYGLKDESETIEPPSAYASATHQK
jgi:uncharacterized membrane-anchored protein YhcB (DUF1043 family)